jgi:hypothetical protein
MKKGLLIFFISLSLHTKGQVISTYFNGKIVDTVVVKESLLPSDLIITLGVNNNKQTFVIKYKRDEATVSLNKDLILPNENDTNIIGGGKEQKIYAIKILPDTLKESLEFINIEFYCNSIEKSKRLTIIIEDDDSIPASPQVTKETSLLDTKFTYLNAFAFDFGNIRRDYEYVGHINLFGHHKSKKNRWYYNVGLLKINYRNNDTIETQNTTIDWIARGLFDSLRENNKYRVEQNAYYQRINNRDYSMYMQPMFLVNDENRENNKFFVHAYLELLVSKWEIENGYRTLKVDSITYFKSLQTSTNLSSEPMLLNRVRNSNSYTYNEITGNFGIGFTYQAVPIKGIEFIYQNTIGFNTKGVSYKSFNNRADLFKSEKQSKLNKENLFYLIRSKLSMDLSDKSEIQLGADIRGYFGVSNPKYALYLGLNLDFAELVKLLK